MWSLFWSIWPLWAILLLVLIYRYMKPYIKGYVGEKAVSIILSLLNKKKYKVLHNIYIPHKKGKSQIDHLIISRYGIFVIETKNYKGWIYGDEHSQNWTQVLYTKKYKLYNPILQNKGHIIALRQALKDYPYIRYINMVVFTWNATLRLDVSSIVIKYYWLYFRIKCFWRKNLSVAEMEAIYNRIIAINGKGYSHIAQQEAKASEHSCPQCYGYLIIRKGKYGNFWGCTNYPNCNYARHIRNTEVLNIDKVSA